MSGYVSPYGKPQGLAERLDNWAYRMRTDQSLPWVGLGIIGDIELATKLLNSREFLENLRTHGTPEQAEFAREILADLDTLDAADDASRHVKSLPGEAYALDPVATIERLDADYLAVREVLVEVGALEGTDGKTPVADLLRALLS